MACWGGRWVLKAWAGLAPAWEKLRPMGASCFLQQLAWAGWLVPRAQRVLAMLASRCSPRGQLSQHVLLCQKGDLSPSVGSVCSQGLQRSWRHRRVRRHLLAVQIVYLPQCWKVCNAFLLSQESILKGRFAPSGRIEGFTAEIGASGSYCPQHVTLPVDVTYFDISEHSVPSPFLVHRRAGPVGGGDWGLCPALHVLWGCSSLESMAQATTHPRILPFNLQSKEEMRSRQCAGSRLGCTFLLLTCAVSFAPGSD